MYQTAVGEAGGQHANGIEDRAEPAQDLGVGRDADVVFGEIDAGFEQRDQFEQLLFEGSDAPGHGALGLLGGDARLVQGGGFDEVADGLGLRKVDAAVQEGAQGELAGLGEAGAGLNGPLDGVAQHDGRAVAGDLNDVLGGVGARGREEGDYHLVNDAALAVEQMAEMSLPGTPGDGAAENGFRDGASSRAGDAHDA